MTPRPATARRSLPPGRCTHLHGERQLLAAGSAAGTVRDDVTGPTLLRALGSIWDYCVAVEYTKRSPHRVPLVIAPKVSAREGHTYRARWSYRKPGSGTKSSGWKKTSWSGDNGRALGIAVEEIWGRSGRGGGPKPPTGTTVCTQFRGLRQKACFRLG